MQRKMKRKFYVAFLIGTYFSFLVYFQMILVHNPCHPREIEHDTNPSTLVILLDLSRFHILKSMEGQMSRSPNLYDLANGAD